MVFTLKTEETGILIKDMIVIQDKVVIQVKIRKTSQERK